MSGNIGISPRSPNVDLVGSSRLHYHWFHLTLTNAINAQQPSFLIVFFYSNEHLIEVSLSASSLSSLSPSLSPMVDLLKLEPGPTGLLPPPPPSSKPKTHKRTNSRYENRSTKYLETSQLFYHCQVWSPDLWRSSGLVSIRKEGT